MRMGSAPAGRGSPKGGSMHRRNNSMIAGIVVSSTVAAACMLMLAPIAMGQVTSGTMSGTVKDPSGGAVANATVVAADADKGGTRTVSTGMTGDFVFANMPPCQYTITVELQGFKKLEKSNIILNVADHINAGELMLEMGTTSETVVVTADAGEIQMQSKSGERSDLISSKQLEDV